MLRWCLQFGIDLPPPVLILAFFSSAFPTNGDYTSQPVPVSVSSRLSVNPGSAIVAISPIILSFVRSFDGITAVGIPVKMEAGSGSGMCARILSVSRSRFLSDENSRTSRRWSFANCVPISSIKALGSLLSSGLADDYSAIWFTITSNHRMSSFWCALLFAERAKYAELYMTPERAPWLRTSKDEMVGSYPVVGMRFITCTKSFLVQSSRLFRYFIGLR